MYYLHFIHQTDAYGDTVIQPEEEEVVHSRETFKYFLAGGIAGAISR